MNALPFDIDSAQLSKLCKTYNVAKLEVFGSAVRGQLRADSDVDFLVTYKNGDMGSWLGNVTGLADALSSMLHRKVDVVPRQSVKWAIRDEVYRSAQLVYADE